MLLSIVINVIFVVTIFTVRYYYAKQEMEFLVEDSERQEQLIVKNETSIDSISTITRRLQIDNDTQDQKLKTLSKDLYDIVRWSKEYEQRLQNLIDSVEVMQLEIATYESSTVPFLQEFGTQDNYIKVFGRTGLRIKDNKIVEANTIADFSGELNLGPPEIEKLDKYEYRAFYADSEFLNLKIKGGNSEILKIKPPRNQISIGPVLGITYDSSNGLTSPIWGLGITYNMVKLWDWK
jgi:transcription antitermination factor NusA-like protein